MILSALGSLGAGVPARRNVRIKDIFWLGFEEGLQLPQVRPWLHIVSGMRVTPLTVCVIRMQDTVNSTKGAGYGSKGFAALLWGEGTLPHVEVPFSQGQAFSGYTRLSLCQSAPVYTAYCVVVDKCWLL